MSYGHMDGIISWSHGWNKEIRHDFLPMGKLVLSDKWAKKLRFACWWPDDFSCRSSAYAWLKMSEIILTNSETTNKKREKLKRNGKFSQS